MAQEQDQVVQPESSSATRSTSAQPWMLTCTVTVLPSSMVRSPNASTTSSTANVRSIVVRVGWSGSPGSQPVNRPTAASSEACASPAPPPVYLTDGRAALTVSGYQA